MSLLFALFPLIEIYISVDKMIVIFNTFSLNQHLNLDMENKNQCNYSIILHLCG